MIVNYFKALADTTRLRIINLLLYHEMNVNEIINVLKMGQSRISRHLKVLMESDILISRRDGLWIFYKTSEQNDTKKFLDAISYLFEQEEIFQQDLCHCVEVLQQRTKEIARFFDSIAEDWERMKHEILGDFDLSREIVKRIPSCQLAADLGCGTGDLLLALRNKADKIIGVDNSQKMLRKAEARFGDSEKNVDLRIGELKFLPIRDAEIQAGVINLVLHHVDSPKDIFAEIYRILSADGLFVIADFDKHQEKSMQMKYGDRWLGFTQSEIKKWLNDASFQILEFSQFPVKRSLKINLFVISKRRD